MPYDLQFLCIKITPVSQWHASLLGCAAFGLLLSLLLHLEGTAMKHFIGLLVNVATVMIVVLLFLAEALDEHIRLEREMAAPKQEKESVEAIKIHRSMAKPERVIKLWQYRTMDMLDVMESQRLRFEVRGSTAAPVHRGRDGHNHNLDDYSSRCEKPSRPTDPGVQPMGTP